MPDDQKAQTSSGPPAADRPGGESRTGRVIALLFRIAAVGVPVLYVIGRVYSDGYWGALGQSSSVLTFDVDDYVYSGFVGLIVGSTHLIGISGDRTWLYVLVGGLVLSVLTVALTILDHWLTTSVRRRLKIVDARSAQWREKHRSTLQTFAYPAVAIGIGFYALFSIVFGVLLIALLSLVVIHKAGQVSGEKEIQRFAEFPKDGELRPLATYTLSNGVTEQGWLLQCSEPWCIVFNAGRFIVIPASTLKVIGPPVEKPPSSSPPRNSTSG